MNETNKQVIKGIKSAGWSEDLVKCIEETLNEKNVHTASIDPSEINITFKDSETLIIIK